MRASGHAAAVFRWDRLPPLVAAGAPLLISLVSCNPFVFFAPFCSNFLAARFAGNSITSRRQSRRPGKRARIGYSESRMAIHFPQVMANTKAGDIKLSMFAKLKQPGAKETAEIIFSSIDFP